MNAPLRALRSADIIPLRAASASVPPPPDAPEAMPRIELRSDRDIRILEIAQRLGLEHRSMKTIIKTLRALHDRHGLPLPRSIRLLRGRACSGSSQIVAASVWDRYLVNCWFDERNTPAERSRITAADQQRLRTALASRARLLAGAGTPGRAA